MERERRIRETIEHLCSYLQSAEDTNSFWFDGEEILCRKESQAEALADFFEDLYAYPAIVTGYYDPAEDERNGEVNDHTGWYYVTIE